MARMAGVRPGQVRTISGAGAALALALGTLGGTAAVVAPAAPAAAAPVGTGTTTFTTVGCQDYIVPGGVTSLQVDVIGAPGAAGQSNTLDGAPNGYTIAGGGGGDGAEITTTVPVTPGSALSVDVGGNAMTGGRGGYASAFLGEPPDVNIGAGGAGGNASFLSVGLGCPTSNLLVVAAGGGGGGGAGTTGEGADEATGGAGASAGGAAAQPGGSNKSNDGGPGTSATASGVGSGGASGYGTAPAGFPTLVRVCTEGSPGNGGYQSEGGVGGFASQDDPNADSGCMADTSASSVSGGGGGGGGGYYGGGGGGGADDYAAAGGGGGAGASYVIGQTASPTPSSAGPSVTITPVPSPPGLAVASSATCTVGTECIIPVTTTGYPMPTVSVTQGTIPDGLELDNYDDNYAALQGQASGDDVSGGSETVPLQLTAANGVTPAASTTVELTIDFGSLQALTVSPSPLPTLVAGGPGGQGSVQLGLTATFPHSSPDVTDKATWSSDQPSVATVSPTGLLTAVHGGTAHITATYDGTSAVLTVPVSLGVPTSIAVAPSTPTVGLGSTQQFTATATYQDGETQDVTDAVTWSTDEPSVATISTTGLATARGTANGGQVGVYASVVDGSGHFLQGSTADIMTVSTADPTSIAVSPGSPTLAANSETQFTATGTFPGNLTANVTTEVTWTSSDPDLCDFDAGTAGLLHCAANDSAGTLTATATAANDVDGQAAVTTFAGDPDSLTVSPPQPDLGLGQTEQMTATARYGDGTSTDETGAVTWTSSDPTIASVSTGGLVTATSHTEGAAAVITAVFTGPDGAQQSANTLVTVNLDHPLSVTVSPSEPTIGIFSNQEFTATGTYPGGNTLDISNMVTWNSSTTAYGGFNGQIFSSNGVGGATVGVTATAPNGIAGTASIIIQRGNPQSITVTSATLGLGNSTQLTCTASYANGTTSDCTDTATWSSADWSVASVTDTGVVTALGSYQGDNTDVLAAVVVPGWTTLTAYGTVTTSLAQPQSVAIGTPESPMAPATSQQFTATGTYAGGLTANITSQVTWSSSDSTNLTVSANGSAVSSISPPAEPVTVTATLGGKSGTTSVTLLPPVSVTGPTSGTSQLGVPFTSATFTASGGAGTYTWILGGSYCPGVGLSATTGTSVTITGTPTEVTTCNLDLEAGDAAAGWDTADVFDSLTVTKGAQAITVTAPTSAVAGTSTTLSATGGPSGNPVAFSVDASSTTGACTVTGTNGTSLHLAAAGTCVVDANQGGNSSYLAAPTVTQSITVTPGQPQAITFSPLPAVVAHNLNIPLSATGGGSGNPVVFSVTAGSTSACAVSGTTLVTTGYGTCTIDANQVAGNGFTAAPQVQVAVQVESGQSLYFSQLAENYAPATVLVGAQFVNPFGGNLIPYLVQVESTAGGGSGTIAFSVDPATTDAACTISPTPGYGGSAVNLSFNHAGTCVIDANDPGNASFAPAAQIQTTITVQQTTQTLAFTSTPSHPTVGGTYAPTFSLAASIAGGSGSRALAVGPSTTNSACTVNGSSVALLHAGTCEVDATEQADADFTASTASQVFTVAQASQTVTLSTAATADVGTDTVLSGTGGPSGNPVTYTVDAATTGSSCTLFGSLLYFAAQGTCVVDTNQAGNGDYLAAHQLTTRITVVQLSLAVTPGTLTAAAGSDAETAFTVTAEQNGVASPVATTVTVGLYTTSATGVFAPAADGAATTTLTIPAGADSVTGYYGDTTAGTPTVVAYDQNDLYQTAEASVTVDPGDPAAVTFTQGPSDVEAGDAMSPPVTVQVSDQFGNAVPDATVSLTPDSASIADDSSEQTDGTGTATFAGLTIDQVGTYTLTASAGTATSGPSAGFEVLGQPVVTAVSPLHGPAGGGTRVTVTGSGFTGATQILFGSTPASGVTVTSDGSLSALSPAGTQSPVDVTVVNPVAASPTTEADQFEYSGPHAVTVTVQAPASSQAGQSVTYKAHVTPAAGAAGPATGQLTFTQGATVLAIAPLSGGSASFTTVFPVGTHVVTATYDGSGTFAITRSAPFTETVAPRSTSTALVVPTGRLTHHTALTVTVDVTTNPAAEAVLGPPTGRVTVTENGKTVGSALLDGTGSAQVTFELTKAGTDVFRATYQGVAPYAGSSAAGVTRVVH